MRVFNYRPLLKFLTVAALFLTAASTLQARPIKFPSDTPTFTITLPTGWTSKPDEDGNSAWYIADYTFIPKVPPGALPVHRKMRESGVLVRHGKEWKFAMTHMSVLQPDENAQMGPPSTAAPVKK